MYNSTVISGLVSEKLAACVNIIPDITSIYEWENKITEDNELLLVSALFILLSWNILNNYLINLIIDDKNKNWHCWELN